MLKVDKKKVTTYSLKEVNADAVRNECARLTKKLGTTVTASGIIDYLIEEHVIKPGKVRRQKARAAREAKERTRK